MKISRLLGFYCLTLCWSNPGWALDSSAAHPVPAKHAQAKVSCYDCHQAENPTGPAAPAACMDCHGDAPAMAEQTRTRVPNPHAPPLAACTSCHRQHPPAK